MQDEAERIAGERARGMLASLYVRDLISERHYFATLQAILQQREG